MNKRPLNLFLIILSLLLTISCNQDDDLSIDENESLLKGAIADFDYIEYGTSFGECYGYCLRKVKVSSSKVEFEKKSWNLEDFPIVKITETNSENFWEELVGKIDYAKFLKLSNVIGCPDCADGGAEWIEIKKNEEIYKVTFEYNNEPETVQNYIQDLRTLLTSYSD